MEADKPVMVGEAPGPSAPEGAFRPRWACTGGAFRRLARVAGAETRIQELRFYASFERHNVLPEYPGEADGKGSRFPREEARAAAEDLLPALADRTVLICGKRAADAFRLRDPTYFEPVEDGGPWSVAYVIPHPSGINRWWNDRGNRERARRFLRRVIDRAPFEPEERERNDA